MDGIFEFDTLCRFIGQTVTIYTTSGGCSGSGFTGVIIAVTDCVVKLLCKIGTAPDCCVGSPCCPNPMRGPLGGFGVGCGIPAPYFGLGSITEIPINKIAAITHNAIAGTF